MTHPAIKKQVQEKIAELQYIMSRGGKGGENDNQTSIKNASNNDNLNIKKSNEGGTDNMNPITRDGSPVVDGKIVSPELIASMSAGAGTPPTDFLALAKSADPYAEKGAKAGVVSRAGEEGSVPETNTDINKALNNMQSTVEHSDAEKGVEKAVSVKDPNDEIADVVARVKKLKKANDEISDVVNAPSKPVVKDSKESILAKIRARILEKKAKVDGLPTDPIKGSEDSAKTPEESVKSIKTTKAESKDRPVDPVGDGKSRYKPDKDIRDQEAKDAESKGKKDEGKRAKEPKLDRPVTHKKAMLAGRLATLKVYAEDEASRLRSKKIKYPVEKSPNMDFEGAAKRTETEIKKEHGERTKDKGEKSPMKTVLWSKNDKRRIACDKETLKKQIKAYTEALNEIEGDTTEDIRNLEVLEARINSLENQMKKLSYVNLSTKPTSEMSWEEIISEGNAVYADLLQVLGAVDSISSPFLEEVKTAMAKGLFKTSEEDGEKEEKDDKKEDDDKGEEKDDKDEKGDKSKKDDKKEKGVAKDTISLLKDINETAKQMTEEIGDHLKTVEKKTGIPVPDPKKELGDELPPMGDEMGGGLPEGLDMGGGEPPMGGLEELPPMPPKGAPAVYMGKAWLGKIPKTAMEEEQLVEEVKKDTELQPEQKWNEIKKLRKTQGWKAVFTKLAEAPCKEEEKEEKEDEKKEASADKKNSYWSVYRGNELVIRATVEDLYKGKAVEAFDWASSKGYGEKLLTAVLNDGITVTAGKLGIQSMVKVSAKSKGDAKSYYKKVYPASYVSELFKEHKKKADAEIAGLKEKLGEVETANTELKATNEKMVENQMLHAKAEKALALVKKAVEKGLVEQTDFDGVVDGVMVMNDEGFDTFSRTILKAPAVRKASIDEKIDMVRTASRKNAELDTPIQIQNSGTSPMKELKSGLEGLWKKPAK